MSDDLADEMAALHREMREGFAALQAGIAALQAAIADLSGRHHELAARVEHRANGANGHAG
ncbi:MAG: hypothetical protein ACYCZN_16185 [Candidatus Dormibacteria bacterium]